MALQSLAALSDDEINELKEDFLKADANKDGALDKQEFSKLLASRVKSEGEIEALFKSFDADGDGKVLTKEFLSGMVIATKGTQEQKLEALFKLYDVDKSNALTAGEITLLYTNLQQAVKKLGYNDAISEVGAKTLLSALDTNSDNNITLQEWVKCGSKHKALQNLLGFEY